MDFRLHNNMGFILFLVLFRCLADCLTPVFTNPVHFYSKNL